MKIALFDHDRKFTKDLIEHWKKKHEVKIDRYWDPRLVSWGDISFFEFCDLSIQRASDSGDLWYQKPEFGKQPQGKKIVVRAHDIDIHVGNLGGVKWDWVTDLIFVAPHLMEKALAENNFSESLKIHLIPHGIDPCRFTFKERQPGKNIAIIGNINDAKRMETSLLVLAELPRDYKLWVVGKGLGSWRKHYVDNYIKENNLNVELIEQIDDINNFLQNMNYLLLCSEKEAHSFVINEACLVGVKPVIHNFWGSSGVWPKEWIWNTVSEAVQMIKSNNYNSYEYYNYVKEKYPFQKMIDSYDSILFN